MRWMESIWQRLQAWVDRPSRAELEREIEDARHRCAELQADGDHYLDLLYLRDKERLQRLAALEKMIASRDEWRKLAQGGPSLAP